jgi:HSP20 family protein
MSLTNYEPWSLLDRFNQQLNQLGYADKSLATNDNDYSNIVTSHWRPAVDIKEEKDRFVITADLPGVDPNNIEITMEDGVLTLKGERQSETRDEDEGYKRVERISGTFYRRFSLPDTADAERIEAKGKHGVLEIVLPKHEKLQPRKIEVKS